MIMKMKLCELTLKVMKKDFEFWTLDCTIIVLYSWLMLDIIFYNIHKEVSYIYSIFKTDCLTQIVCTL